MIFIAVSAVFCALQQLALDEAIREASMARQAELDAELTQSIKLSR